MNVFAWMLALNLLSGSSPGAEQPLLIASSAQTGMGAQNAASSAASSGAATAAAGAASPVTPAMGEAQSPPFFATPYSAPVAVPFAQSSFSESSSSNSSSYSSLPPLRDRIEINSPGQSEKGDLGSFFQIPNLPANTAPPNAKKSKLRVGRLLWHILDNAGVPMFFGKNDAELDPSLQRVYVNPPLPTLSRKVAQPNLSVVEPGVKKIETSSQNHPFTHKIPDSELEGL